MLKALHLKGLPLIHLGSRYQGRGRMWTEASALPEIELHAVASFVRAVMCCTPRQFVYFELNDFYPRGWWALFRIPTRWRSLRTRCDVTAVEVTVA